MSADSLVPTRISPVRWFDGNTYAEEIILQNGKGYVVKFGYPQYIYIAGESVQSSIPVFEGWNMIGVFDENVSINQISTIPSSIITSSFLGFEGSYEIEDTLKPGKGYWVMVSSNGLINLNSGVMGKDADQQQQITRINNEWGRIIISDSEDNTITLFAAEGEIESDLYALPPILPSGIFDVRYSSNKLAENLNNSQEILINSAKFPVTIKAEGTSLRIREGNNGQIIDLELISGQELIITNDLVTAIEVTKVSIEDGNLPSEYELQQNYPNPFNPSTTFKYSIAKQSSVLIRIYDLIGNEIETLVNEEKPVGTYELTWNANNLPSGVYFYQLQAGDFVETKKMILMK
jgi:hypothetical protein